MNDRVVPDRDVPGAFWVRFGPTQQSFVDPDRPDFLLFEYVQHVAMLLDHTLLDAPAERRLRVVHIGGAGMTLPRWVAWRRPGTAQVVCEPDVALTEEVRRKAPLPPRFSTRASSGPARSSCRWCSAAPPYSMSKCSLSNGNSSTGPTWTCTRSATPLQRATCWTAEMVFGATSTAYTVAPAKANMTGVME